MYMTFYNEFDNRKNPHCENDVNFWAVNGQTIPIVDWLGILNHLHNKLEAKVAHLYPTDPGLYLRLRRGL